MNENYINFFTDFGFKRIFGTEPNKDLLIDFLNQLFSVKKVPTHNKITDITYLPTEQLGEIPIERNAIFDIYCETDTGEKVLVEMQRAKQKYFKERSIYYSTHPIRNQAPKGDWDFNFSAVYTISILDFTLEETADDASYYHHKVQLMETDRKTTWTDKLTYIYLEIPKFVKTEDELTNNFERWLFIIKNLHKFENRPEKITQRIFQKLFKVAKIAAFTKEERDAYEQSVKTLRDNTNIIDYAHEEGREKGRAEGREEGRAEGIEIGEKKSNKKTALKMLKDGLPHETIAKYTNLTIEEITNLAKSN